MKKIDTNSKRSRRFVLGALGAVSMTALLFAAPVTVQSASDADLYSQSDEAIYIVKSSMGVTGEICRVFFDDVNEEVNFKYLATVFGDVYNLGLTPDGKRLGMLQKGLEGNSGIGFLDLVTGTFITTPRQVIDTSTGDPVSGIVMGAFAPMGSLLTEEGKPLLRGVAGSETGGKSYNVSRTTGRRTSSAGKLYHVDPTTGMATSQGYIWAGPDHDVRLVLEGADLAFAGDGQLYVWTNHANDDQHQGLYRVDWIFEDYDGNDEPVGRYEGTHVEGDMFGFSSENLFITGLAFRFNGLTDSAGRAEMVGSVAGGNWIQVFGVKHGRDDVQYSLEYDFPPDVPAHTFGDMASALGPNGTLPCTYTIGYWMNHRWEYLEGSRNPGKVELCGDPSAQPPIPPIVISQEAGQEILRYSTNRNFSMLTAQLIAAKLNAGASAIGLPIMDTINAAEEYLCDQTGGIWSTRFTKKLVIDGQSQKQWATGYKDDLVYFNEGYIKGLNHCD